MSEKIKNLQETPASLVVCRFFASAIMKVTENLIYVSEIVSSNFLFCQNFVSPSCSLSLSNLLLTCFAVKPNQPVCWFHEEVRSLQLCWGRTVAVCPALHPSRRRQLFFPQTPSASPQLGMTVCGCAFWETLCPDYLT